MREDVTSSTGGRRLRTRRCRLLAVGDQQGNVTLWNLVTRRILRTFVAVELGNEEGDGAPVRDGRRFQLCQQQRAVLSCSFIFGGGDDDDEGAVGHSGEVDASHHQYATEEARQALLVQCRDQTCYVFDVGALLASTMTPTTTTTDSAVVSTPAETRCHGDGSSPGDARRAARVRPLLGRLRIPQFGFCSLATLAVPTADIFQDRARITVFPEGLKSERPTPSSSSWWSPSLDEEGSGEGEEKASLKVARLDDTKLRDQPMYPWSADPAAPGFPADDVVLYTVLAFPSDSTSTIFVETMGLRTRAARHRRFHAGSTLPSNAAAAGRTDMEMEAGRQSRFFPTHQRVAFSVTGDSSSSGSVKTGQALAMTLFTWCNAGGGGGVQNRATGSYPIGVAVAFESGHLCLANVTTRQAIRVLRTGTDALVAVAWLPVSSSSSMPTEASDGDDPSEVASGRVRRCGGGCRPPPRRGVVVAASAEGATVAFDFDVIFGPSESLLNSDAATTVETFDRSAATPGLVVLSDSEAFTMLGCDPLSATTGGGGLGDGGELNARRGISHEGPQPGSEWVEASIPPAAAAAASGSSLGKRLDGAAEAPTQDHVATTTADDDLGGVVFTSRIAGAAHSSEEFDRGSGTSQRRRRPQQPPEGATRTFDLQCCITQKEVARAHPWEAEESRRASESALAVDTVPTETAARAMATAKRAKATAERAGETAERARQTGERMLQRRQDGNCDLSEAASAKVERGMLDAVASASKARIAAEAAMGTAARTAARPPPVATVVSRVRVPSGKDMPSWNYHAERGVGCLAHRTELVVTSHRYRDDSSSSTSSSSSSSSEWCSRLLVLGSWDGSLHFLEIGTGKCLGHVLHHGGGGGGTSSSVGVSVACFDPMALPLALLLAPRVATPTARYRRDQNDQGPDEGAVVSVRAGAGTTAAARRAALLITAATPRRLDDLHLPVAGGYHSSGSTSVATPETSTMTTAATMSVGIEAASGVLLCACQDGTVTFWDATAGLADSVSSSL